MGALSLKFSIAPSGKTADLVQTSSFTMPNIVGIVGHSPAVDEKVWCFVFCLSVCHGVIFKTIMVSWNTWRFVVVHLQVCSCALVTALPCYGALEIVVFDWLIDWSIFNFFCGPQNFPVEANLYQKFHFCRNFGAVSPQFKTTTVKFGMWVRNWDYLP